MKNKQMQQQRMKGYFIQATKEIIKGEGLKSISVRNIADKAGYSYATLYNYFKDLNELLFYCISDFQQECNEFVYNQNKNKENGIKKINGIVLAYIHFFIQYPSIFDLFYLTKIEGLGNKDNTRKIINTSLTSLLEEEIEFSISNEAIKSEVAEEVIQKLKHTTIGMLLLYLNRVNPESYKEFIEQAKSQIALILYSLKK